MIEKIKSFTKRFLHFLSIEIWRIDTNGLGRLRAISYNIIKSFVLTYRNLNWSLINTRASALTYSTLLSIVPLLAVLFAIARGFGFQNILQSELFGYFRGQQQALTTAFQFIDKSLEYAQGGIFLGIGLVLLLYTALNLISNIEDNFNSTWGVKNGRSYYRQFTDYTGLLLVAPVLLVCNAGFSIVLNSSLETFIIGAFINPFIQVLPFILTISLFAFIYAYIPNTKVKIGSAIFAGIVAGICFQVFQQVYISGQIWISKYNTIYGSFAALPLLLLWLQISWLILLVGVELSFAHQNIAKFNFEKETKGITRRYKDFIILLISTLIVKRFETGEDPYTANEISEKYKIPTRLTSDIIYLLLDLHVIIETPSGKDMVPAYIPAIDIYKISVSYLFHKVDSFGSEDFNIDITEEFIDEWNVINDIRNTIYEKEKNTLIKDL